MANRERGELTLVAGDVVYTLALTIHGACEVEHLAQTDFETVCDQMQRGSVHDLRYLIWGALQLHHGAAVRTLDDAADIVDAAGGWRRVIPRACQFLRLNTNPYPAPTRPEDAAPDPRHAQGQSGSASTWTRAAWV